MVTIHPQYITDTAGKKMVVLPAKEFDTLIDELDELECIKVYDKAMARKQEFAPAADVFKAIEKKRKR